MVTSKTNLYGTNLRKSPALATVLSDVVWSKIFRKDFLQENNIYFNDYRCMEDIEFSNKVLAKANFISCLPVNSVNYRIGLKNSLSMQKHVHWKCMYNSWLNSYNYFEGYDKNTKILRFINAFAHFYNFLWEVHLKKLISYDELYEIVKEFDKRVLNPDFVDTWVYGRYKDILYSSETVALVKYFIMYKFANVRNFFVKVKRKIRRR